VTDDFKTMKLGQIGKVSMCKRILKAQTSSSGDIPFYKISTFGEKATVYISEEVYTDYVSKYSFPKKGDVLISAAGTVGKTVIYDGEPAYFQDSNIVWIDNDEAIVDNKYLYYFYQTNPWRKSNGSTITRIYNDDLRSIDLIFPQDKSKQTAITKILSELDSKIALNNKINAELEQTAQLIYHYWFTQFDFPSADGLPYKSSGGAMVFDEKLKREIPHNWNIKPLKEVAKIIMGQSPKGSSYNQNQEGVPLLNGPADYEDGSLVGRIYTTEPTRLCVKDDLVFCVRATIGNLTYAEKEFCLGRGVAAVRVNDTVMSELIYFALLQEIERFKIQAGGSIIIGITKEDLIDSNILLPSQELISNFHSIAKPIFDKVRVNKAENLELVRLRDWFLPMLMTGQVKVDTN
jgi:type I restriction enzyme S subunit